MEQHVAVDVQLWYWVIETVRDITQQPRQLAPNSYAVYKMCYWPGIARQCKKVTAYRTAVRLARDSATGIRDPSASARSIRGAAAASIILVTSCRARVD